MVKVSLIKMYLNEKLKEVARAKHARRVFQVEGAARAKVPVQQD